MTRRRLILVTGAPRSATTPVGNLLALSQGAVSLYEPLGPTGLSSIGTAFPMIGHGLGIEQEQLAELLEQLGSLRLGKLKSQNRSGEAATIRTRLLGSRTLHSLRLARLQPWSRTVIWKDPHAVLMVPDLVENGVDVVVTVRTPWAHAASYKRLGWRAQAVDVYPRWAARYGACEICERHLEEGRDVVVGAALLWRLSYLPLIRTGALRKVHLVTSQDLERDERATYLDLLRKLELEPTRAVERSLGRPRRDATAADMKARAHDWRRSVASVNSYWREVLSERELATIHALTDDIAPRFVGVSPEPPDLERGNPDASGPRL